MNRDSLTIFMGRFMAKFSGDIRGAVTVEWALLLAAFGLPMMILFRVMLYYLTGYYQCITCLVSLPLP